jgi:glycosyltransferase involved in cell wall biosynthesis
MSLSLALCTYNRAQLLERALASLAECDPPRGDWELLLIDNNSRDRTREIARGFEGRLPLRYLFEETQGLSAARNLALRECRGDVLLFTDDDLRFDREWLRTYVSAFAARPESGWFGGRVQPWWEQGKPAWLHDDRLALIEGLLVHYDLGAVDRAYHREDPSPFGASFALRRATFERTGDFRLDLGVKGAVPGRGEESEYFERIHAAQIPGWYVGGASAWHWQDANRFTLRHLYIFGIQKGIAEIRMGGDRPQQEGRFSRELSFAARALAQWLRGRGDRARQCVINMGIERGLRGGRQ